jgi:hypothetical protein
MDGRNNARPKSIVPSIKNMIKTMMTCGELAERRTSLKVNSSTDLIDGLSLSKRLMIMLNIVKVN